MLPPVILATAEINPPVNKFAPVILAADVIVDVADINPPVIKLPPVILPVALAVPPVAKLPPVIVDVADINPPVFTLPASTLPVVLKLVPVAAPMLGVVKFALALTMILPEPSNAVVTPSTNALNTEPVKLIPA